jgi:hypothetical protein
MADQIQTFKAICRGGLNTTGDVLSQGEESPGSATKLINYEPDLQGGYRRMSGFANSYGTVTGTGSVLGLAIVDGINQGILACRTPSSGNNYLHHYNHYYSFTVGADTNLTVGETLTERSDADDSSTVTSATGVLISKNSNTIVVNFGQLPTTIFTNGNFISDDSFSTSTNISSAPTVVGWTAVSTSGSPTMTGVSKVRFTELNFGSPKVVLTDGINPAATYDGSSYTQITDSNAPTDPVISEVYQNHLFLAGDPAKKDELFFSAPLAETDFTPANGAGSFNVGFDIVAIKVFRNILYIFGTNNIKRLVGNNRTDFVLENVTNNLGCLATDSVIEIGGDLIFLGPDGIRPIGGTAKIGDVNLETVSTSIHKTLQNIIQTETLSSLSAVLVRSKSQFRYFFSTSGSTGVLGGLRSQQGGLGFEFGTLFGIDATCAASAYIGTTERVIHGDSNGKVHVQESGTSFDGSEILSIYQTPYLYFGDPRRRKTFYDVSTYLRSEGVNSLSLGIVYDFDDSEILTPSNLTIANESPAAVYGSAIYDTTQIYDGNPAPVETSTFTGSGKSISFRFVAQDTNASHSIQGFTVTFGMGDLR